MKQQNLALKKLKGIKPKGVKPRPSSKLEKLIEARNRAMDDYCFKGGLFLMIPFKKNITYLVFNKKHRRIIQV